ncbi:MAG: hypothetical protein NTX49_02570 [Chlamydiae bacterium]|nr:hypothetical protein [Chlamydiota bacterium]
MNSKKIMSVFGVAILFAQMGFADVSQEITADEAQGIEQQMQEIVSTNEEADAALLLKKQPVEATQEAATNN